MRGTCEIKGVAFHTFFLAVKELRGEPAVEATRAQLTPELRDRLRLGAISRVGYCPLATYAEVHAAAHRALRGGEPFAREIGRKATEIDTRGVLRFVLGLASPALLMRHAGRVLSSYARGAQVLVEPVDARRHVVQFSGLAGASELIFAEIEGSIAMLIAQTGAVRSVVRREDGEDGTSARYSVSWEE